jgi:DNA-binding CsgD family transcriptional regulator
MRIQLSDELLKGVVAKEPKAIIQAINELLPMADMIIKSFARKWSYKRDDIRSVAYAALTNAVNKFQGGNLAGYARVYINGHIRNFLKTDHVICPPRWEQDEQRQLDPFWEAPEVISMDSEDWVETARAIADGSLHGFYEWCLSRLLLNKFESRVLSLCREGRNSSDIARQLDVSHTLVLRARNDIEVRFNTLRNSKATRKMYFGEDEE